MNFGPLLVNLEFGERATQLHFQRSYSAPTLVRIHVVLATILCRWEKPYSLFLLTPTTLITRPIRLHCLPYIADDHELKKESTATKTLLRLAQATNIGLLRPGNWLHVTFVRG